MATAPAMQRRPFPLSTGIAEVVSVCRPTPRLVRLELAGAGLDGLPDEQPGEIITLIWPAPGADAIVLPTLGWRFPPGTPEQHARNYTIRRYDRDRAVVTVDVVLHGDHGYASRWAQAARPGGEVGFAGPRIHYEPVAGADWTLLAGDETALPSIAATLERMPAGARVCAFVEVADELDHQPIATAADVTLDWVHRAGPPGTGTELLDAVRAADLPAGTGSAWVAGEALVVRGLREHLRDERGVVIGPMQAIGYWKHRDTPEDVE